MTRPTPNLMPELRADRRGVGCEAELHENGFDATDIAEAFIRPLSLQEEAWFAAKTAELDRLDNDEELPHAPVAPAGAPIVFLDLDDVVCLYEHFGAEAALECVTAKRTHVDLVYGLLFALEPVKALRAIHDAMGGHVRYVVSSTWRRHFNRAQLRHVLRESGLDFVSACMESRERWCTPSLETPDRRREIELWLEKHHAGEPYVVLDDVKSGQSLGLARIGDPIADRSILCEARVGLEQRHVEHAIAALGRTS
jgi:hypothetical protein